MTLKNVYPWNPTILTSDSEKLHGSAKGNHKICKIKYGGLQGLNSDIYAKIIIMPLLKVNEKEFTFNTDHLRSSLSLSLSLPPSLSLSLSAVLSSFIIDITEIENQS